MLINPQQLPIIPGTNILNEDFGLAGVIIEDPRQRNRTWAITRLFSPHRGRLVGGIRAKLVDNLGFISFINQRDLELLLDLARPGDWCPWLGAYYPGVNSYDEGWFGICCDDADLLDELHEYELLIRQQYSSWIPEGVERTRRVHSDNEIEYEELLIFLWDKDPDTNCGPDGRLETLQRRWVRAERRNISWSRAPM